MQAQPDAVCHHFVKGALQFLVPVILDTLKKQVSTSLTLLTQLGLNFDSILPPDIKRN